MKKLILNLLSLHQKVPPLFAFLTINYLLLTTNCLSQITQEWVRRYPDTNIFTAFSDALALDDSSNVYIAGGTFTSNWSSYCTIKYNSSGTQQWVANYYGIYTGGRGAAAIALDRNLNVYVTGYSFRYGTYFDYCTIKYNSQGVEQWVQYYDGPAHDIDQAQKIAVDNSGNVYVTGFSASSGGNNFAYATIKYSSDGEELWVRRYGGGNTYANGIAIDDSCNVYITGINNGDAVTIKYDSSGNQSWVQVYSGGAEAKSIALDRFNNVYITGYSRGAPPRLYDFFTIKYSLSGIQQWVSRYYSNDTSGNDNEANSIVVDNSGCIYVSGHTGNAQGGYNHFCTIKYTNSGDSIWVKIDTAVLGAGQTSMALDSLGNVYLSGSVRDFPYPYPSYGTMKYDSSGNVQWSVTYNNSLGGGNYPRDIKIDINRNVFITGTGGGMLTIKYSQPVGITNSNGQIPEHFRLYQNYPNPFNSATVIRYQLSVNSFVTLKVYDMLGREVAILVNEGSKPGTYDVEWDASNYSSGIYFYRITTDGFFDTKKMILIK